jgi:histidine triad (HIT) family protein
MANKGDFDFYCESVLTGKIQVKIEYESENVLAFHKTNPKYPIHIMVIPKKHIHDLIELTETELPILHEMLNVIKIVMSKQPYKESGGRIITNVGKFQETPHLHFHVVCGDMIKQPS